MIKLIFILLISFNSFSRAFITETETLSEKKTEFGIFSQYYKPTSFVNSRGENLSFGEGESYQSLDLSLIGKYGVTDRLEFSGGVKFRTNQSQGIFEGESQTLNASGLESALFSIKYSYPLNKQTQYSLIMNYQVAAFDNNYKDSSALDTKPETIALGEGSTNVSAGVGMTYITRAQNFFTGSVLYRNPGKRLSSEIFSDFKFALAWRSVALILGVENVYSLNDDAYTDEEDQKPQLSLGSSRDFNSINRSWTAPYLGLNIGLNKKWRVEFQGKSFMQAAGRTLGNQIGINLISRGIGSSELSKRDARFKEYKAEGSIIKVSKSKRAVSINIGLDQGIEKGSKVDFYIFDYLEGNELIATGYIVKAGISKSIVKITKRYSKQKLKEGITARSGLIK